VIGKINSEQKGRIVVASDTGIIEDLVMKLWAAIALLGDARGCLDTAHFAELVLEAERLLSNVIAHLAASTLIAALTATQATSH
jgi:hypothetical protein